MKNNFYENLIKFGMISFLIILILNFFSIDVLFARPGGGHSYSGGGGGSHSFGGGGGHSYSGGGGGGGGGSMPIEMAIPIFIIVVIIYIIGKVREKNKPQVVYSGPTTSNIISTAKRIKSKIQDFKTRDANFSKVVFLDFASSIFNKYYSWYSKPEFKNLSPFLSQNEVLRSIEQGKKGKRDIKEIVIGSVSIDDFHQDENFDGISVDFDANFTVTTNGRSTRFLVVERWIFVRKKGTLSIEPNKMRELSCPNCGASSDFTDFGECTSCSTLVNTGEMQWLVSSKSILKQETFSATNSLGYYAPEQTPASSVFMDTQTEISIIQNLTNTPWQTWFSNFTNDIVRDYFIKIFAAWSSGNISVVRNLLTDRLFKSYSFWIDAYNSIGYRNVLQNIEIENIFLANIEIDKFYQAITVRVHARSLDYVVDRNGKLTGGSNKQTRRFSEYWTFVRSMNVKKENYDTSTCPNCGAPADRIGQAGVCEYCSTKISNGDFSWVLAIVTQDEAYKG